MNNKSRPVRLWVPEEEASIQNRPAFLDSLIDQTIERLSSEPIDLYAFPTYLPAAMRAEADQLWTEHRVTQLLDAFLKNQVAVEINTREQLPSRAFIEQAKQAGCKFGFGTANGTAAELKPVNMAYKCWKLANWIGVTSLCPALGGPKRQTGAGLLDRNGRQ
jgi:histidinol phosphatase-like PHP family hydrolase